MLQESPAQENAMHYHLTSTQLLVAAFALTLGIIFALAAVARVRLQKVRPFRNYWSEYDRNLFPDDSFSKAEDIFADEPSVFTEFGARYSNSADRQTRTQNKTQQARE
jgi:hypothetical protein